mmetsp:Transcript_19444/g.48544  ORF Transcript_19444/g.48544 Transcript_19444/m.48544 type:complete len:247 (-) Transcript_19444:132-872(-)
MVHHSVPLDYPLMPDVDTLDLTPPEDSHGPRLTPPGHLRSPRGWVLPAPSPNTRFLLPRPLPQPEPGAGNTDGWPPLPSQPAFPSSLPDSSAVRTSRAAPASAAVGPGKKKASATGVPPRARLPSRPARRRVVATRKSRRPRPESPGRRLQLHVAGPRKHYVGQRLSSATTPSRCKFGTPRASHPGTRGGSCVSRPARTVFGLPGTIMTPQRTFAGLANRSVIVWPPPGPNLGLSHPTSSWDHSPS